MSKGRISSPQRKTRRTTAKRVTEQPLVRYLGLSLSGGKSDKSCLAVLDFYSSQKRIFLARLHEKIKSEEFVSADFKIYEMIEQLKEGTQAIAFDAPLTMPLCIDCPCGNVGFENCHVPEIKWMRNFDQKFSKKKPRKAITPYTQRPIDLYLSHLEDENLEVQHTLGANLAPLAARAQYLQKRMTMPCLEVFPRLAVWRMGQELKVGAVHLRSYRNSVGGEEARRIFLNAMTEKAGLFLYQADQKLLTENLHAFDALICAWVAYLKDNHKTETKPADFPKSAAWIEFPKKKVF